MSMDIGKIRVKGIVYNLKDNLYDTLGDHTDGSMTQAAITSNFDEITSGIASKADVRNDINADFDIADDSNHSIARFTDGHIQTQNFDSRDINKIKQNVGLINYQEFSDESDYYVGNIVLHDGLLYKFTSNHTSGSWDSSEVEETDITDNIEKSTDVINSSYDFDIADENGLSILRVSNGYLKTKNFDSENIDTEVSQKTDEYLQYLRGGSPSTIITGIPSNADIAINDTIKQILATCPYADIILIANPSTRRDKQRFIKRRAYIEELKAFADFYSFGFINLRDAGISRPMVTDTSYYTTDGTHTNDLGSEKLFNYIYGFLTQRYNGEENISSKKILVMGDSSCAHQNPSSTQDGFFSWSTLLMKKSNRRYELFDSSKSYNIGDVVRLEVEYTLSNNKTVSIPYLYEFVNNHSGSWTQNDVKVVKKDVYLAAVGGSGWSAVAETGYTSSDRAVSVQFNDWKATKTLDPVTQQVNPEDIDIIIIGTGGNELNKFKLDYSSTMKYLCNDETIVY